MAQASWSAPTRMVFLLHGEDSFRTRLRVGELVGSLRPTRRGPLCRQGSVAVGTCAAASTSQRRRISSEDTSSSLSVPMPSTRPSLSRTT
jgi:hypothetical protein